MSQDRLAARVRAAQGGSLRDFEILVQRFQDMAVGYSRGLLDDFHLAEDAAQDAFVLAYTRLGELQDAAAFPGWFRQIVFSCCMRYRQRRRDEVVLDDDKYLVDTRPGPDDDLARREQIALLNRAFDALNEAERTALTLHYIRAHSLRDLAAFLEVSPTTVKNRLRSAKKKIQGRLLTMARDKLAQQAPSQDKIFARKVLDKVEATVEDTATALVGALHGITVAAGIGCSAATVNSVLGYSFHFCIKPDGARTYHYSVIEWELFFPVLDRLGFETRHFQTYLAEDWVHLDGTPNEPLGPEELAKFREDTWTAVCAGIDRGLPAIAWSPMTVEQKEDGYGAGEWGLLVGYDEEQRTYTVHHRWRDNRPYTVPFDGFGRCDHTGWYYVIAFGDRTPPDEQTLVAAVLKDAIAYAAGTHYDKDGCCYPVEAYGFAAYQVWRDALRQGLIDTDATRHHADQLKHNRRQAAIFLRHSARHFDDATAQALADAASCYEMEVAALAEVRDIASAAYKGGEFTGAHRREAAANVGAALAADKLAIGHIEEALAKIA